MIGTDISEDALDQVRRQLRAECPPGVPVPKLSREAIVICEIMDCMQKRMKKLEETVEKLNRGRDAE